MALGKGLITLHKQGYISEEEHAAPHAPTETLGQTGAPHDAQEGHHGHDGSNCSCMGGGYTEEPPIIVGDIPHAQCWGRTDILWAWVVVEAMPPKTEQNGKTCRQCNVNANRIKTRRCPPVELLWIRRTGEGDDLKNQQQTRGGSTTG
jgi:hypothetical protein